MNNLPICPIEDEDAIQPGEIDRIRGLLNSLLSLSDIELSGVILRAARSQYHTDGAAGLDMNNSDIIGLNGLYFRDVCDAGAEGINFTRSDGKYDTLRVLNGKLQMKAGREFLDGTADGFINIIPTDTGWVYPEIHSGFTEYAAGRAPRYRKTGDMVYIAGTVKPTAAIAAGTEYHSIFTLPADCRPAQMLIYRFPGSGSDDFWLTISNTTGNVSMSRYADAGEYKECTTSNQIPFSIAFMVGD